MPDSVPLRTAALSPQVALDFLGGALLAYCCGVSEELIKKRVESASGLTEEQEAVFQQLLVLGGRLQALTPPGAAAGDVGPGELGMFAEQFGMTLANALRIAAGSTLPDLPEATGIKRMLLELARDAYPSYLYPSGDTDRSSPFAHLPGASLTLAHHPTNAQLEEAAMKDEVLGSFFENVGEDSTKTTSRQFLSSAGSGSNRQLAMLGNEMLSSAYHLSLADGEFSAESFLANTAAAYDGFRSLISGEAVEARTLITFEGVELEGDETMDLPWGRLRRFRDQDRFLGLRTSFGGLVLESKLPFRLFPQEAIDDWVERPTEEALKEIRRFQAEIDSISQRVALCLILALDRPSPATVKAGWRVVVEPGTFTPLRQDRGCNLGHRHRLPSPVPQRSPLRTRTR
jgi:hypothetical protein